jgi:hypothetical protein
VFEEPRERDAGSGVGAWVLTAAGAALVLLGLLATDLRAVAVGGVVVLFAVVRAVLDR